MRSSLAALAGLMLFAGHAAQANVAIIVDKNSQTMTVAVDGIERYHWWVSTGIPSYETPNGSFRTFRMEAEHYSKEFDDAPMPYSIFFTKIGHAIHGTDFEGKLGMPASHGCVRLSKAHAATLYALVEEQGVLNTTVTLTGSSVIALARNPGTNVARRGAPPPGYYAPPPGYYDDPQYASDDVGEPVLLMPQSQFLPGRRILPPPQERAHDGSIYPADGSPDRPIYPAPRSSRPFYGAQAYPQPQPQNQYYDNPGYAQPPPGYYQPRAYPRGYFYQN